MFLGILNKQQSEYHKKLRKAQRQYYKDRTKHYREELKRVVIVNGLSEELKPYI